MLFNISVCIDP